MSVIEKLAELQIDLDWQIKALFARSKINNVECCVKREGFYLDNTAAIIESVNQIQNKMAERALLTSD